MVPRAASTVMSCFSGIPEGSVTIGPLFSSAGVAETSLENGLSFPTASTAVTMNQYFVPLARPATMASVPLVAPSAALFCTPGAMAK